MHPFHPFYFVHRSFGFGRRLVWFGLGAFAAHMWHKHHEGSHLCGQKPRMVSEAQYRGPTMDNAPYTFRQVEIPPRRVDWESSWGGDRFDRERLRELGNQASDALADASESMLDSAFSTLEILRTKLREQRALKEREQAEAKKDEESKRPA